MNVIALDSAHLPRPKFRYTPVLKAGPWVLFSGMIALDAATGALVKGGPGDETRKILRNLSAALPDLSLSLDSMATARIYTTRFEQFAEINKAWEEFLEGVPTPPTRTSLGVSALPLGASVEMEFAFYADVRS